MRRQVGISDAHATADDGATIRTRRAWFVGIHRQQHATAWIPRSTAAPVAPQSVSTLSKRAPLDFSAPYPLSQFRDAVPSSAQDGIGLADGFDGFS